MQLTARRAWFVILALWCVCWSMPRTAIFAQDEKAAPAAAEPAPAAAAAPAAAEEPSDGGGHAQQSTLMWLIHTSGWIGLIILIISMYFVATIVQLFIEMRMEVVAPPELQATLEADLQKRDYNSLYQHAKESSTEYGDLVAAGISSLSSGLGEAREAMDRTGEAITVEMEKRISMLAVIGSLGPMIGLLGTLKGMIGAFSVIAMSDTAMKPGEVAGNISEALVLTFEGVALSLPAIYFYAVFRNRVSTLSVRVQNMADELLRKVYASAQSRTAAPA